MTTALASAPTVTPGTRPQQNVHDPVFQAFTLLRIAFTAAPILFGLDKFAHVLVNWDIYLAPRIDDLVPGTAHQAMYVVGLVEVVAGLVVAVRPKYGALLVAAWRPPARR